MILHALIPGRIGQSCGEEAGAAQAAGVTTSAGPACGVRLVAGHRLPVIDIESRALTDDLGLGEADEGCVDATRPALDTRPRCERRNPCECFDELRPAVRVAA